MNPYLKQFAFSFMLTDILKFISKKWSIIKRVSCRVVAYHRSAPLNSRGSVQRSFFVACSYHRLPDTTRSTLFLRKRVVTRLRSAEAIRSRRGACTWMQSIDDLDPCIRIVSFRRDILTTWSRSMFRKDLDGALPNTNDISDVSLFSLIS